MPGLKTINLEENMPTKDACIRRLTYELHNCRELGYTSVKLIHGYGSSGAGGRLRVEVRRYLDRSVPRLLRFYIPGEEFSIFGEATRGAFLLCPELRRDPDIERHNNGVTFVIL